VVDFHSGHPAFRISLSDAATPDQVRRVRQATPMPADMVERSRLKFNHQVHLDPNGVRDPDGKRNPAGMHDAQGQRTVLDCQSCHVPADGGRLMAPVKMEQHCQSCHSLAFEPSVTSRQVVHGEDTQIATMLREFYARLVLGDVPEGVHPPDDLPRLRPGAVLTAEGPAKEALDALSKQISALSARIQAPTPSFGGRGPVGGAGGGAAAPGTTAPAGAPGAAATRPAPVMNEIEREQMMLQMQRAISSTISGQLSSVVSTLEGFTLPVTAETKADIKELSSKLKALAADVKNIGVGVRKIVPAPVKKD
jgi:hypothetical protein